MRAVDTNVLVYAEISNSPRHEQAKQVLEELAEGEHPWALPWPCVYEFVRVVTHPGIYHPPVPLKVALEDLEAIMSSPSLMMLGETARHAAVMERVARAAGVTGNLLYDAHIAALCIEHGVKELITGDRDFTRFQDLRVVDPFRD